MLICSASRAPTTQLDGSDDAVGRKIEQFEIDAYSRLCAEAERMEFTHQTALLTSILNQEELANELLGALGQGKGPLDKLVKKVVLEHASAAAMPAVRAA